MRTQILRRIRGLLAVFILGVVASGLTALPLAAEAQWLDRFLQSLGPDAWPPLVQWIAFVDRGLATMTRLYPFLAYGTDWLAFAHLVIALAFVGPYRDPARNRWVVEWGLLTCALVLPLALLMGAVRGIPLWWRCIDCGFGLGGFLLLWPVLRLIGRLEVLPVEEAVLTTADR